MPINDWTRVDAGIFHHFHLGWLDEISGALNDGLLPPDYYALAEQIAGGLGPDVLTLQTPTNGVAPTGVSSGGGIALATAPPKVQFHVRGEADAYAAKANKLVIRHTSNHQVVAMVEIVSPGNKNSRHAIRSFIEKAGEVLRAGIHLLIADLFPPGPRDPQGIHKLIWDEVIDNDFVLPGNTPLTLVSYIGGLCPEAFIEPVAVGQTVPEMPLFLTPEVYVLVPLEKAYLAAWKRVPAFWRRVLENGVGS
jgi:hypothetical protein